MQLLAVLLFVVYADHSLALSLNNVEGLSATLKSSSQGLTFLGGMAGPDCGANRTKTCSNCTGELKACNQNRIGPMASIKFYMSTTSPMALRLSNSAEDIARTQNGVLEVNWSHICAAALAPQLIENSNCQNDFQIGATIYNRLNPSDKFDFKIAVVGNSTPDFQTDCNDTVHPFGICSYATSRLADSITYNYFVTHETFPALPRTQVSFLKLYYSEASFSAITLQSPALISEVSFNGTPTYSPTTFTPPRKGRYYFKLALEDQAGNLGYFTPTNLISPERHHVFIQ